MYQKGLREDCQAADQERISGLQPNNSLDARAGKVLGYIENNSLKMKENQQAFHT